MAVLTRLDRLAERADSDETKLLRAVSEDIEDFYDVLDSGGDADAFIEARRPQPPAPRRMSASSPYDGLDAIDLAARIAGVDGWSHCCPEEVPIGDLDPRRRELWDTEGWIRAERSHYREWLDFMARAGRLPSDGCAAAFEELRESFYEAREAAEIELGDEADEEDVAARAAEIYLAGLDDAEVEGVEWQASTSSTSPPEEDDL
jgi:hypothetical protein